MQQAAHDAQEDSDVCNTSDVSPDAKKEGGLETDVILEECKELMEESSSASAMEEDPIRE